MMLQVQAKDSLYYLFILMITNIWEKKVQLIYRPELTLQYEKKEKSNKLLRLAL